jgi:hypothetical protein
VNSLTRCFYCRCTLHRKACIVTDETASIVPLQEMAAYLLSSQSPRGGVMISRTVICPWEA